MDLKYLVFWMKFKVLYQNTRVFVWINRFFICNNTSVLPKHEKPECKCVRTYVMWLSTSLSIAVLILNDPHGPYLHVYCLNTPYLWEITRKTNAKYVFCQDRSRNFRERERLTSFLHAPWNQLHLCQKCSRRNEKFSLLSFFLVTTLQGCFQDN